MPGPNPDDIRKLGEKLADAVRRTADRTLTMAAAHAADHMIVPGGLELPVDANRLTNRMGRLLRAINAVASGHGNADATRWVKANKGQRSVEFGYELDVDYAAIHEYGGTIPARTQTVTAAMRRFFWAMWYETGLDKWRAMALAKGVLNIPAIDMPARPYAGPGAEEAREDFPQILNEELRRAFA